ncbi:MAG: hypothetical protein ACXADB_06335 [Candidatus Hermodarchaeia archaeon]
MEPEKQPSSAESQKLAILRTLVDEDPVKRELIRCLSDGLWHTTSELARFAKKANPVVGLVTVGTILTRLQEQLSEQFLEQMIQQADEGVSSWRIGVEWLDVVKTILKAPSSASSG